MQSKGSSSSADVCANFDARWYFVMILNLAFYRSLVISVAFLDQMMIKWTLEQCPNDEFQLQICNNGGSRVPKVYLKHIRIYIHIYIYIYTTWKMAGGTSHLHWQGKWCITLASLRNHNRISNGLPDVQPKYTTTAQIQHDTCAWTPNNVFSKP